MTLVPTRHCFEIDGQPLFTWCAFDTVLFPPSLMKTAHVHSMCPVTGQPIIFVAIPSGTIKDLTPAILLSIEEAAAVGKMVAKSRFIKKNDWWTVRL